MHRSVRYTELQSPNEQEHNFWLAETIAIFLYLRVYRKRDFFSNYFYIILALIVLSFLQQLRSLSVR